MPPEPPIPLRAPGVDQALIYVRLTPKNERDDLTPQQKRVLRQLVKEEFG